MQKQFTTIEDLINVILDMNGPRAANDAALQSGVSLPTPFGKMIIQVVDYDLVSDDPTLQKLKVQAAKDTSIEEVVRQTLGKYRDVYRRALSMCALVNQGVQAIKAENTTYWLLEGKRTAQAADNPNKKWKIVATVTLELPGDKEGELTIR